MKDRGKYRAQFRDIRKAFCLYLLVFPSVGFFTGPSCFDLWWLTLFMVVSLRFVSLFYVQLSIYIYICLSFCYLTVCLLMFSLYFLDPCLLLSLFPVLVVLSRIHLLCLHLKPHFDLSLFLVLVPLKVDTKRVNPVPMYLSHALTVSQNLFQNDRDRMTAQWRQRMMKIEGEKTIQRDGSASHQPFSFTPAWGNQPSIMHHMSPSNSREPSNRILATATNCCLFRCWPMGEPCFWSAPANQDERGW